MTSTSEKVEALAQVTLVLFVLQKEPNKAEEAELDELSTSYCTSLCTALAKPTAAWLSIWGNGLA